MTWQDHFTAAEGFLEMGMSQDAHDELEKIEPGDKIRPEIYALRLQIYLALGKWDLAEVCARHLRKVWPDASGWWIAQAACTRQTEGIDAAAEILREALKHFPEDGQIFYHLACLASATGDVTRAKVLLATGIGYDDSLRARALDDEDLRPVWDQIANME